MSTITLAFIFLGFIVGVANKAGILILVSTFGFMWIGNAISGILTGKIQTILFRSSDFERIVHKTEEPFNFYFEIIVESIAGGMILIYFFRNV